MKTTVYTAFHKPDPILRGRNITPIHVGRATAPAPLQDMIGDDTGTSISDRNGSYCELTGLYWAWKNDTTSDYVGLMHYRRFLDLTDQEPNRASAEVKIKDFDSANWTAEADNWIETHLSSYDLVVPRAHTMGRTMHDNYIAAHEPQDFDLARDIIARDHPDYLSAFDTVASKREVLLANMAIFRRDILDQYCTWLFDILFKIEAAALPRSTYTAYQARYLGFLSERLFTVFVRHLQATNPDLRIKEVSILNVAEALLRPAVTPNMLAAPDSIVIAFASDLAYLPHAAAMVRSVLDHTDPGRPIDFVYLHSDISPRDMSLLREVLDGRPQTQLHAVNVAGAFDTSYRSSSRAPSNATYNRFLLFDVLGGIDRVLYLDADVIVRSDLAPLFDTDMGKSELAGVTDWIMTRTLTGPTPTVDPDTPDLCLHHRETLGLSDEQIARYVNAGVLLFNFGAMDVRGRRDQLMSEVEHGRYLFRDQDILNKTFKNALFSLDPRWNVFNTGEDAYGRVPATGRAKAMAAKKDPWIIHYADRNFKPWDHAAVSLAHHYWDCVIRTPFYGQVIGRKAAAPATRKRHPIVAACYELSERFPVLRAPMLRVYSAFLRVVRR